ncbi:MAG: acyl-CoA dehydrogenase family protein [Slackia sp.]
MAHHTLNRGRLAVAALRRASRRLRRRRRPSMPRSARNSTALSPISRRWKFMLADMEIALEASRLLLDRAADAYMDGSSDMMKTASAAKVFCSEHAVSAARDAVQIFGGYGLCKDYPVERYYRDARAFTIIEGTSQVQKTLVAKAVLKEYAKQDA